MHICFLCNEYPKEGFPHGGFGTFVKTIALQLVKAGNRVSVVGINYKGISEHIYEDEISIYRSKMHKVKGLSWFLNAIDLNKTLKDIHKKNPIDIIEASELGLAFINKIPNIKYIIRLHGGHHFFAEAEKRGIDGWKGLQEKRSFKKADGFIAVSEYVKNHTHHYLSFNNKPLEVISNPVDIELFKPSKNIDVIPYKIIFVGTVCKKKGVWELIQAFQEVRLQFISSTLDIYGRDWNYADGRSYVSELRKVFSVLQLDRVRFMGAVAHQALPRIYESASLCVFPSHIETQGLVAPEAMAMEKLVIFSNTGPGPETIIDGVTGFLIDPYKPAKIAEKIIYSFKNKEATTKMGRNAREAVLKKFDPEIILEKNIKFYCSILTKFDQ